MLRLALLREEEAREVDKVRLVLGPSVGKECAASAPPAYRRDFAANDWSALLEGLTYVQYNMSAHTSIGVSCLALL